MPPLASVLETLEPVYKTLPGWQSPTYGMTEHGQLPQRARDYLKCLADSAEVEVSVVSTGPERDQTMWVPGSRLFQEWSE